MARIQTVLILSWLVLLSCAARAQDPAASSDDQVLVQQRVAPAAGESAGIAFLREYQERQRLLLGLPPPQQNRADILDLTLKRVAERQREGHPDGEGWVHFGVYKYPLRTEGQRFRRVRAVIRRVHPGADESPELMEPLARQLASIEMVIAGEEDVTPRPGAQAVLEHVLLGTVPDVLFDARGKRVGDEYVIIVSQGALMFIDRAARAAIQSCEVKEKPSAGATYSFDCSRPAVERTLLADPRPAELLYETLRAVVFEGYIPTSPTDPLPASRTAALTLLVDHAERFVLAHEYGHVIGKALDSEKTPSKPHSWSAELLADDEAFQWELVSARELDLLPENVALQGALFLLAAQDVIRKAIDVVQCGNERKDEGTKGHPPTADRIVRLERHYLAEKYRTYDLPVDDRPGQARHIDMGIEGARVYSGTLELLWKHLRPRFVESYRQGQEVYLGWGNPPCRPAVKRSSLGEHAR